MNFSRYIKKISSEAFKSVENETVSYMLSDLLLSGAFQGGEINEGFRASEFSDWLEKRLKYQLVFLNRSDYYNLLLKSLWYIQEERGASFNSFGQHHLEKKWISLFQKITSVIALKKLFLNKFGFHIIEPTYIFKSYERFTGISNAVNGGMEKFNLGYSIGIFNFSFETGWFLLPEEIYKGFEIFVFVRNEITRINLNAILDANCNFRRILRPFRNYALIKNASEYGGFNVGNYILPVYLTGFIFQKDIKETQPKDIESLIKNKNYRGFLKGEDIKRYFVNNPNISTKYIDGGIKGISDRKNYLIISAGALNWGEKMWGSLIKLLAT
ncbi:MAG: hypothetical protein GWP03_00165 [Proteobacteria bacterium]|nr:hypothetical protein [Pseudomonadota bacterium]